MQLESLSSRYAPARRLRRGHRRNSARLLAVSALVLLTACGGGGGGGSTGSSGGGVSAPTPAVVLPPAKPTAVEASRFLGQATFGATDADITAVMDSGYGDWIDAQIRMAPSSPHLAYMDARLPQLRAANAGANLTANQFYETFWGQAALGPDQLRQRVKLALSEIFVVSFAAEAENPRGMASFYDVLGRNAFGNFRTLLDEVTYHPAMGLYLTYLGNQKEDLARGRNPDENYAREVMQLMTIGLYELNLDGTVKKDFLGNTKPTYSATDIAGLAKVFTGLSWYHSAPTNSTFFGASRDPEAYTTPMMVYSGYHSTASKAFLGTSIPASANADAKAEIKVALDTLFNHPNVGPFISRQLIQRLVTSNPSPQYVERVAKVFNDNGSGVRGDLGAVVRAILIDSEARIPGGVDHGKLREPIVRLGNWMRSFELTSKSGNWLMGPTHANTSLSQSPLTAPSVFNFFRPGYVPPNTRLGAKNLQAPEFQITDEVSVASYLNTMQHYINFGLGGTPPGGTGPDIVPVYAKELALVNDVPALVERMNLLLYGGTMSASLKARISTAVTSVSIPSGTATQSQIDNAKLNRVKLAILLSMASPEYIAQR